jgi:hypothetical protein
MIILMNWKRKTKTKTRRIRTAAAAGVGDQIEVHAAADVVKERNYIFCQDGQLVIR